jgi:hypothetical protein
VKYSAILAILLELGLASPVQALVIQVPGDQPTIQAGINAAVNGDTVMVAPGTYVENINFNGKRITVASSGGAKATIIDGGQVDSVVTFASGENRGSVLKGFTLQNGATGFEGGGIVISSSPTVMKNIIKNNIACNGGGGIGIAFASPLVKQNKILNNSQRSNCFGGIGGGGISIRGESSAEIIKNVISTNTWQSGNGGGITLFAAGAPLIQNNKIVGNTAVTQGGAIWVVNAGGELIVQNLIHKNTSAKGAGIYLFAGSTGPILVNNTIANNNGSSLGSALYTNGSGTAVKIVNNVLIGESGQNAVYCDPTFGSQPPTFTDNDAFSANGTGLAGTCAGQSGQNGNISADPLFTSKKDFRLMPGSPAIEAGDNSAPNLPKKDLANKARIVDGDGDGTKTVDMGAYEFQ